VSSHDVSWNFSGGVDVGAFRHARLQAQSPELLSKYLMYHVIFVESSPDALVNDIVQFCMYNIDVCPLLEYVSKFIMEV